MVVPLLLPFLLPLASSLTNFPVVQTSYGAVRGYEYTAKNGFTGEIFKLSKRRYRAPPDLRFSLYFKIPYAAPPINSRRWKKPVPPEKWNHTIDGTFFGPACAQRTTFWKGYVTGFSEDCLNLNIYTSKECRESKSCPIVHYIHGGVTLFDGTMMFPDEAIVANFATQGVIMVTVEYRMGFFGVMALGDENVVPANLAIHDVLEALRFVKKEIHNFGGDKYQISVMGHSSGATMALVIAFSPGINKPGEPSLVARAISMSGPVNLEFEEVQVQKSHGVATALGCEGSAQEIYDCLLPFSTDEILNAESKVGGPNVFSKTHLNNLVIGGELMPISNIRELRENMKPIKLMLGSTLYEMNTKPIYEGPVTTLEVRSRTSRKRGNQVNMVLGVENDEECSEKYFSDVKSGKFDSPYSGSSQGIFVTNWVFSAAQARAGGEVYLYQYDYPAHAVHTDDIYYLLGFHEHPRDVNEEWLSRVYPLYFTNFIKGLPLAPDWKAVNAELMNYYSVNKSFTDGVTPKMKLGYNRYLTDYYTDMMEFDQNLSNIKKKLLNAPVQYKELILLSTEPVNIRDILFYSTILGILLFIAFKFYQYWRNRQRSVEETPLLIDRINNNV